MPTYDFRCPAGHDFERFFGRISTAPGEVECPTCGAIAVRQISGGAGLVFKGSGFYITDYGKDGKKDQKPAAKSDTKADGKSDGKSDAKSDASRGGDGAAKSDGGAKSDAAPAKSESTPKPAPAPSTPSKPAGDA